MTQVNRCPVAFRGRCVLGCTNEECKEHLELLDVPERECFGDFEDCPVDVCDVSEQCRGQERFLRKLLASIKEVNG